MWPSIEYEMMLRAIHEVSVGSAVPDLERKVDAWLELEAGFRDNRQASMLFHAISLAKNENQRLQDKPVPKHYAENWPSFKELLKTRIKQISSY